MGLIPMTEHRLPMMPATPELEKQLESVLKRYGLAVKQLKVFAEQGIKCHPRKARSARGDIAMASPKDERLFEKS